MTIPSAQMRLTLAQAGDRWDAIRVTADIGTQVMKKLGGVCGSVVADGRNMWFFVQPGEGYGLEMPGVTRYLRGDHVLIPADKVTTPPGPHWTRTATRRCTPATRLLDALQQALRMSGDTTSHTRPTSGGRPDQESAIGQECKAKGQVS